MAFERMSFFFFGANYSNTLESFLVSLEKNETKKGFPLLSGLGFSGIKNFEQHLYFKLKDNSCIKLIKRKMDIFTKSID
jgi:hypothetical protein